MTGIHEHTCKGREKKLLLDRDKEPLSGVMDSPKKSRINALATHSTSGGGTAG